MKNLVYLGFCLLSLLATGQTEINDDQIKKIKDYLTLAESAGFNGQILIAQNNKILLKESIGFTSDFSKIRIKDETVFGIASITKQFTATAIAKLVQSKKLMFDDRLEEFFDNVPVDKKEITIHHLLTHSSGITGRDIIDDYQEISKEELLETILNSEIEFKPGEKWRYSNAGYNLLAFIIEKKSGKTYEEFLNEVLFEDLGMDRTGIIGGKIDKTNGNCAFAQRGFEVTGTVCDSKYNMRTLGGGNIYSTVNDLYKWNTALRKNRILKKHLTDQLFAKQYAISKDESYGYGWFNVHSKKGGNIIEHGGDTYLGYNGCIYNYTDHGITLIILNNKFDNIASDLWMRWAIFYPIRDILFKNASENNISGPKVLGSIPIDSGIFQGRNGVVQIESKNNQFLLTTNFEPTSSLLYPLKDSFDHNRVIVREKTENLLQNLLKGNMDGYKIPLEEAALKFNEDYINEWKTLLKNNGKLLDYQIVGVIPSYFNETIKSYVKLFFENNIGYISYRFLDNGRGRLSGSNPDDIYRISRWFYGTDNLLVGYDLWNNGRIEIIVLDKDRIKIGSSIYSRVNNVLR